MKIQACLTSLSSEWETPDELFNNLNKEFNFKLDPACKSYNQKTESGFPIDKGFNGLDEDWYPYNTVFLNPPYGREIKLWIAKAYQESLKGATIVCLLPSRTDTSWWHEYCMRGEIRFIKGRLKFINRMLPSYKKGKKFKISPAPFPSAIVIFRGKN